MLIIVSDLHLGRPRPNPFPPAPSTCSQAGCASMRILPPAQWKISPIEELHVLLMGDILDPLHSTKWLFARRTGRIYPCG